jgi:fibronectin type 3 domain-containing protein
LAFRYNVYRKDEGSSFTKINNKIIVRDQNNLPIYNDIWLETGKTYSYYVTISDPQGNESKPSKTVKIVFKDVVSPKMISGIKSNSNPKGVILSWNMAPELDAVGYNIYRSRVIKGDRVKLNKKLIQVDMPYFVDSTVVINKQYFYSVTAVDTANNESKISNSHAQIWEDFTPPLAPSNFVAKPEKGFVKLSWKKTEPKSIMGYFIYRGLDSVLAPRLMGYPINETTFIDSGYSNRSFNYGETLHYFVSTVDSSRNESEKIYLKVEVPDVEPPVLPTNIRVETKNGIYAIIKSNPSVSKDVAKYFIYKREEKGKQSIYKEFNKAPISLRDSTVKKGNSYFYAISVVDSVGNKSEMSDEVEIFIKDSNAPPAPRNIRAKLIDGKVTLSWGKVVDFDLAGYNVYRSSSPSGTYILLNKELITELSFKDQSKNKEKFYRIRSVDTSGNESKYEKSVRVE